MSDTPTSTVPPVVDPALSTATDVTSVTTPVAAPSDVVSAPVVAPPTDAAVPPVVEPSPSVVPETPVVPPPPQSVAPAADPTSVSVDDIVAQAMDVQQTFAAHDQLPVEQPPIVPAPAPAEPATLDTPAVAPPTVDEVAAAPAEPSAQADGEDAKKSPLDILEEILGKQGSEEGAGDAAAKVPEEPAVPEKTPEEIAAEQARIAAEEQARLEAKRQEMLQEVTSTEQQQRDAIRINEIQSKQVDQVHDIYQIKRQRLPTTPAT